ncbi:hypothetical protein CPC08DRAFT_228236 [Agrocybe pediades]|nr:hypothetical protein CPC08DRAFT_228236 [Agrocybe pediades]
MYQRDPRAYAYDDQITAYSSPGASGHSSHHSADYSTNGYPQQHGADQYYTTPPTQSMSGVHDVNSPNPYYRSMTPALAPAHRNPNSHVRDPRYYNASSYGGSSSTHASYAPTSPYSSSYAAPVDPRQLPVHRTPQPSAQFIPTPSEMAHSYNYNTTIITASIPEETYPPSGAYPPSTPTLPSPSHGGQRPSRISTGRPRTGSVTAAPTSPSGERFPCEVCGKTFSRSHDRKRHHETQHSPVPITHKCPYCVKAFSRNDSLKRHLDNGCDHS